ncbi:hypothetical protein AVEN_120227-1 [Araneus ventricosus]|uniref:Integrase zinc-binding domain-containing protein n=1 Tax=Araneus ventricosus TaxID=182803 RepID=A0A4Y2THH5_ARAVE|nr:hypothetical protein AVEN_120227-1 [Araneus ventricosus]
MDVLARRLCIEFCDSCSNTEKKFRMGTDISVVALTMTTEDRWSLNEIQKAQVEDPEIKPILKMKLNSADRPSWRETAHESPATKRYWILWNFLYLKDGVLYRKWESNDGGFYQWKLIVPNNRIQEVLRETHGTTSGRHFGVLETWSPKLQQNGEGPYAIVKKLNDVVCCRQTAEVAQRQAKSHPY